MVYSYMFTIDVRYLCYFFFEGYGHHRDLHLLTHSFPTLRSSDLLDMAFEKFRRVQPVDDRLLDLIYNLALDFERKRQFNKAESAYQYIAGFNKAFRDVPQKLSRAKKLSETVILGGSGGTHPGGTLVLDDTQQLEKPMLGRYQIGRASGRERVGQSVEIQGVAATLKK